ncbi:MAG: hypothetical protein HKM89_01105, partial [Gemmatimonadales bacterium]|nr:hypothetical protein [Gemmatimonadales bacterium]
MLDATIRIFVPNPAGAIWIGVIIVFVTLGDFRQLLSKKNLVLSALLVQAAFLLNVVEWGNAADRQFARWGFTAIYVTTFAYTVWG